mgnify:FL=1
MTLDSNRLPQPSVPDLPRADLDRGPRQPPSPQRRAARGRTDPPREPRAEGQVRALVLELKSERGSRPKVSLRPRTAQVFAYLLTRGDKAFQNYYLSASRTTIAKWATKFRRGPWLWRRMGKGGLAQRPARHRPAHARDPRAARLRRMGPHLRVDDPHLRERDPPRGTAARGGRPRSRHPLPQPVRAPAPGPGYRTAAHPGRAALRERNG